MSSAEREKDPLLAAALMLLYSDIKDKGNDPAFLFVIKGTLRKYDLTMEQVKTYKEEHRARLVDLLQERGML